jgi:hypothetical protein
MKIQNIQRFIDVNCGEQYSLIGQEASILEDGLRFLVLHTNWLDSSVPIFAFNEWVTAIFNLG